MHSVLLIEDDALLREGIATLLTAEGIEVLEAESLSRATAVLSVHTPEVIVVDGALPDGNGIEWISMLRSEGNPAEIIFVSNYFGQPRWIDVLKRLGVRKRLNKRTTTIREISEAVQGVLPVARARS